MTSPARLGMIRAAIRGQAHAETLAVRQAELYLAVPDDQRDDLARHFAAQNTPQMVRARTARLTRYRRHRAAAEQPFADMTAFEAQFRGQP